ncbi:MAG: MFS transporter [Theionarchaea archaeon]|nr:MFS transporter [Theionarchaea archaeon]MBU7038994.1 MFS transporter [Theionarchaea archaeon]
MERRMLGVFSAISFVVEMRKGVFGVFFSLYLKEEIAASFTQVGIIWTLIFVVSAIFQTFWGWTSDRAGQRKLFLIVGEGIPGIVFLFIPRITDIYTLSLVLIVLQVCWSMAAPVWKALIAEHSMPTERGTLIGKITTFGGIGTIIGYYIVGDLISQYGYAYLFYFCSLCMLGASLIALYVDEPEGLQPVRSKLLSVEQVRALYTVRRHFSMFTFFIFLTTFASAMIERFISIYVRELGGSIQEVSFVFILADGIITLSMIPMGKLSDRIGRVRMLQISVVVRTVAVLIFAVSPVWWYLFLAVAVEGIGWSGYYVSSFAVLSSLTPKEMRGTYMGIHSMIFTISQGGSSVGGPIADRFDLKNLFYSSFAVCALVACGFIGWLKSNHETINESDN